jgi:hypothetical protein
MQRRIVLSFITAAALAFSQQQQSDVIQFRVPGPPPGEPVGPQVIFFNNTAGAHGGTMEFVRNEFGPTATVKGAPYSAEALTESIQTLPDGNRIVHRDSVSLARDKEGRTRRDVSMPALPGMQESDAPKLSFIFDPTTNTSYTLNHTSRTASKGSGHMFSYQFSSGTGPVEAPGVAVRAGAGIVTSARVVEKFQHVDAAPAPAIAAVKVAGRHSENTRTDKLGKQTMEGVAVEGTRTVITIPAGQIGNERPIEIISERWYSPELQMVIMTKHSDPRSGETTYKVSNLRREDPPPQTFEVPSGYTMEAGPKILRMRTPDRAKD